MAQFFLTHRVFAIVISLVITLAGVLSVFGLPISLYPQISPPVVRVETTYTGASAEVVEETVAVNIESQINGAEGMLYMSSKSSSDGRYVLDITFGLGRDPDLAMVDVQNRLQQATAKLPQEVVSYGVTVKKQSPDKLMVISLYSPDHSYDAVFLSNYASINLVDPITRVPGVGNLTIVGQRDYAMRLWLRPDKLAKLGLTADDITNVIKEQNVQAPAGQIGQPPAKAGVDFQYTVNVKGRLATSKEFEGMVVRTLPDGSILRIKDVARTELAAQDYNNIGRLNGVPATVLEVYQLPGANALQTADGVRKRSSGLATSFPPGLAYEISTDNTRFITASLEEVVHTFFEALAPRGPGGVPLPGDRPRHAHPHAGGPGLHRRDLRRLRPPRLLHQHAHPLRPGARHRDRGGRRHRGGRGGGAPHRAGAPPLRGREARHGRGRGPGGGHRPGPLRGLRARRLPGRDHRPALPPVRPHPVHLRPPVRPGGADPHPGALRDDPPPAHADAGPRRRRPPGLQRRLRPPHGRLHHRGALGDSRLARDPRRPPRPSPASRSASSGPSPRGSCRTRTRDTSPWPSSWRTARQWSVPMRWRDGPRVSCAKWRACRVS